MFVTRGTSTVKHVVCQCTYFHMSHLFTLSTLHRVGIKESHFETHNVFERSQLYCKQFHARRTTLSLPICPFIFASHQPRPWVKAMSNSGQIFPRFSYDELSECRPGCGPGCAIDASSTRGCLFVLFHMLIIVLDHQGLCLMGGYADSGSCSACAF